MRKPGKGEQNAKNQKEKEKLRFCNWVGAEKGCSLARFHLEVKLETLTCSFEELNKSWVSECCRRQFVRQQGSIHLSHFTGTVVVLY